MTWHLAVIDMQKVFRDGPWGAPRFAEIVPAVSALAAAAPAVTHTRFVAPAAPHGAWRDYYRQWDFALQPPDAELWDLVLDHDPADVLTATTFGKWGPELGARVGRDELVLAGVATDCCVLSTALAAADAGVPVRVVTDACAGADDAAHDRALAAMALYAPLIRLCGTSDLV